MRALLVAPALALALAGYSSLTAAQTTAGTSATIVVPVVAQSASFNTEITAYNPNAVVITVGVAFYDANNTASPGLKTCTSLAISAGRSTQFAVSTQCALPAGSNFGMLILTEHTGTHRFYGYARTQTPQGIGFSTEGFPIENFNDQLQNVTGLKRAVASAGLPAFQTNCFVATLSDAVDYELRLFNGISGAQLGGTLSGSLGAFQQFRYLDVFAAAGVPPGDKTNVRAQFTNLTGVNKKLIGFCTVQDNAALSADFRIAKSFGGTPQNAFVQGGNAFGTTALLGTVDNQPLSVLVNNQPTLRLNPVVDVLGHFSVNVINGSPANNIDASVVGGTVSGGGSIGTGPNLVTQSFATIGGGGANGANGVYATVGGGGGNSANGIYATVAGGGLNVASDFYATVAGGAMNTAIGLGATVAGGESNAASGEFATVSGGAGNFANAGATVAGGGANGATGAGATISGGGPNTASGAGATIAGGHNNVASGEQAMVAGGIGNTASGIGSFAAGSGAQALADGSMVFGDSTTGMVTTNVPNAFVVAASGGIIMAKDKGLATGCFMPSETWSCTSDRNMKRDFAEIDPQEVLTKVLALPVTSWRFKSEPARVRHVGPVAQDFYTAFGLGFNDVTIAMIDEEGIALAAIQGLHQLMQRQNARIDALERELREEQRAMESGLHAAEAQQKDLAQLRQTVDTLLAKIGSDATLAAR